MCAAFVFADCLKLWIDNGRCPVRKLCSMIVTIILIVVVMKMHM